jgi:Zn-dependent membrane protease YugP
MLSIDPLYVLLAFPAFIVAFCAQLLVHYFYSKYSKIPNSANVSGADVVEMIARGKALNIRFNISLAELSDHYNPLRSELTLSERVARAPSIASIGIAAHEMGHVVQHKHGALLMGIRTLMVPIVNIGSTLGYILFIIGLSLQVLGVTVLGIILFSSATVFTIITLPIEIDASVKALKMIKELNILTLEELGGVKKVLFAAALTYVAAVAQSLSSLLYFILRAFGARRRD